ncbi:carboxymuconolactone decarboxylase family protein [Massilia sp. TS11]|uniref:carboxymuconolactone decarboxylase family protein n=1 Tax=Massilia sp. TS11 TaxID=2908003 RepID=UPI001EDBDDD6|nr:carboxymuconolactone decarboxylase family protein [Massilia sp. TS11]MCG2585612.1 carboxymuconolactone decarboxylase family protein [Massilia sp. TS11]
MPKFLPVLLLLASVVVGPAAMAADPPPQKEDPMRKVDPSFTEDFHKMYVTTWGEGAIPKKYKELTGASISVVERCEPCLRFHLRNAKSAGASVKEMMEALRIGLLTGGSITLPTVRTGYEEILAPGS